MTENSGMFWHVHHDKLVELSDDIRERIAYIKADKPQEEQETRLRLFRMIPQDRLHSTLVEARQAHEEVWQAYKEVWQAYEQAEQAFDQARQPYKQARKAYEEAREAYDQTWQASNAELTNLHRESCPDCPWDGETIFPKKEK